MTKTKNNTNQPVKIVVTDPKQAIAVLRTYLKESDNTIKLKGIRNHYASVMMMVNYFSQKYNQQYDPGWLGRSLNLAANNGLGVTTSTFIINGESRTIYRLGK